MATIVSQPTGLRSGLRALEYVFNMPSVGVAPEHKTFIYMLKVDGVNVYQEHKEYKPIENNQNIKIDFVTDLRGYLITNAPPYSLPPAVYGTNMIKQVVVEYGERTFNTETCEDPVDDINGDTIAVSVLNGINRVYETTINSTFQLLTKRPSKYCIGYDAEDFLYLTGVATVTKVFYGSSFAISNVVYNINQPHPGGLAMVVPIGFQGAPAGTVSIKIYINALITAENPTGLAYEIERCSCQCDDGSIVDLYVQNHMGGVDLISFDCVDTVTANLIKQEIVNRYDRNDVNILTTGQRQGINNESYTTINLKKTFDVIDAKAGRWLAEMASSNNCWAVIEHEAGAKLLVRMIITGGSVQSYGEATELILPIKFSEVELYPY